MSTDDIIDTLSTPLTNKGASYEDIDKLQKSVMHRLPESYVSLMIRTNGIEGFVGQVNYIMLWPVELQPELNDKITLSLEEKLVFLNIDTATIFPFTNELGEGIDNECFYKSFLQQPRLFLRLRPGKE